MASDRLLTELQRQQKYLERLPDDFTFPLFNAKQAIDSQRASAYRNTGAASREIVDNAMEAGADKIHVIFDTQRGNGNRRLIDAVAFIDNGSGMLPKMVRYASVDMTGRRGSQALPSSITIEPVGLRKSQNS